MKHICIVHPFSYQPCATLSMILGQWAVAPPGEQALHWHIISVPLRRYHAATRGRLLNQSNPFDLVEEHFIEFYIHHLFYSCSCKTEIIERYSGTQMSCGHQGVLFFKVRSQLHLVVKHFLGIVTCFIFTILFYSHIFVKCLFFVQLLERETTSYSQLTLRTQLTGRCYSFKGHCLPNRTCLFPREKLRIWDG